MHRAHGASRLTTCSEHEAAVRLSRMAIIKKSEKGYISHVSLKRRPQRPAFPFMRLPAGVYINEVSLASEINASHRAPQSRV
jgi:hypothetical protein